MCKLSEYGVTRKYSYHRGTPVITLIIATEGFRLKDYCQYPKYNTDIVILSTNASCTAYVI
jgi:hypothetical protein